MDNGYAGLLGGFALRRRTWTATLVGSSTLGLSALLILGAGVADAQVNTTPPQQEYVVIKGIQGDSTAVKGAIDIQGFGFTVSTSVSISAGSGGGGVGRTQLSPISFSKQIDSTTPLLLKAQTTHQQISGDVYFANPIGTGRSAVYYDLHFVGFITEDAESDSVEQIQIQPQTVNLTYTSPTRDGSGTGSPSTWGFNALMDTTT